MAKMTTEQREITYILRDSGQEIDIALGVVKLLTDEEHQKTYLEWLRQQKTDTDSSDLLEKALRLVGIIS